MIVHWGGSFESKEGKEKITLYVPEGSDEELYLIKKAVKNGTPLRLIADNEATFTSAIRHHLDMAYDLVNKAYELGKSEEQAKWQQPEADNVNP